MKQALKERVLFFSKKLISNDLLMIEQRVNYRVSSVYLGRTSPRSELPDLLRWDSWSESEESAGGLHRSQNANSDNTLNPLQEELTDHQEAV